MEYTVENTDRESGFIQARKEESGLVHELTDVFLGERHHSAMTVVIFDNPAAGGSTFRVTVGRITEDTTIWGPGSETPGKPLDEAEEEARALIAACAPQAGASSSF